MEKVLLRLTINVGWLEIPDEVSTLDRREIERVMFDEVLQKSVFPRIEYKSSGVNASKMGENVFRVKFGDLTLDAVRRGAGREAQFVAGEDTFRAQGSFTLRQYDYG